MIKKHYLLYIILILLFVINPVYAYSDNNIIFSLKANSTYSDKVTLFIGSSYDYSQYQNYEVNYSCWINKNCQPFHTKFIVFRDVSDRINNINNRYVEIWLLKDGNYINRGICYNHDICNIGDIKLKIISIFIGKESAMFQFKLMRVYD